MGAYKGQEVGRGQQDSIHVIPAAEFVGMGRRFIGIEDNLAVRCPCYNAVDLDTRHARICPRAGAEVNQHRPLLHTISPTFKRLGIRHQVECAAPFTADINLQMDIVIWRRGLRHAPNQEYRDRPIPLDVTDADPQPQVHLRGGSGDHDRSVASTFERANETLLSSGTCVLRQPQTCHFGGGKFWGPRGKGQHIIDQLAASVAEERGGGWMTRKGVVKECLLQIISVAALVTISRRVSRFKLQLRDRKQGVGGGGDRPTPTA